MPEKPQKKQWHLTAKFSFKTYFRGKAVTPEEAIEKVRKTIEGYVDGEDFIIIPTRHPLCGILASVTNGEFGGMLQVRKNEMVLDPKSITAEERDADDADDDDGDDPDSPEDKGTSKPPKNQASLN